MNLLPSRPSHRQSRRLRKPVLLVVLLLLLTTAGCTVPEGARDTSAQRLAVEAPFEAVGAGSSEGRGATDSVASGGTRFDRRLRQRTGPGQPDDSGGAVSIQRLSLGGGMSGDLPGADSGWRWARDGDVTLAQRDRGDGADALVYVQAFSAAGRQRPSMDAYRFQLNVDRELATTPMKMGSELWPSAAAAAPHLPLSSARLVSALEMLRTPTLGRGLGYRSDADSFTGWRWIGTNREQTLLRLARTRGTWGDPLPLAAEVEQLLEILSLQAPELGDLLWQEPSAVRAGPAWMILGSASREDGRGVHLAVLCRLEPECAAAGDLGLFLHSLRPIGSADRSTVLGQPTDDLQDLALNSGLVLLTGQAAPDTAALSAALSRTAEAHRLASAGQARETPEPVGPDNESTSGAISSEQESNDAAAP